MSTMKKLYKKEKYETEKSWLRARVFGGSSVSALFNVNPYMSALDVYCASVNPPKDDSEVNETDTVSTIYGHLAEPVIRNLVKINFQDKFDTKSPNGYVMYRRKDKPYMTATLDGILVNKETKEKWVLEIKTYEFRGNRDLEEKWDKQPPIQYSIQCLHYLAVLNDFVGAILVAKIRWVNYDTDLVEKEEIRYYTFDRKDNQEQIDKVEQVETDFQNNHIIPRIPPDVSCDIFKESEDL